MKFSTINKLDNIANMSVDGLITEYRLGITQVSDVKKLSQSGRYPTQIELIKGMIKSDIKKANASGIVDTGLMHDLINITKSTEQFNYLANAIDAKMKKLMWKDEKFASIYRSMFEIKQMKSTVKTDT